MTQTFFICEWFRATSVAAFRLGILCLYVEIFHQGETFFWVATGAGVLVFLYWVACILTVALLCRPVASNWDLRIPRTCGSVIKTEFASAGFNLGIDLWVVMLPLPIVWRLHMSSRKKLGVMASFALGIVYVALLFPFFSACHINELMLSTAGINLGRAIQTRLCPYDDLIYCMRDSIILVFAEIATSILVACVPTLGPLLFRRWSGTRPRPNIASHTIGSARAKKPFERLDEEDLEFDESRGTWRLRVRDLSTRHLDLLCLVVAAVQCGSYVTIRFLAFVSAFFISSLSVS